MNIPDELYYEICKHLILKDILQLESINKYLNNLKLFNTLSFKYNQLPNILYSNNKYKFQIKNGNIIYHIFM